MYHMANLACDLISSWGDWELHENSRYLKRYCAVALTQTRHQP
jgi:hypothetical protein